MKRYCGRRFTGEEIGQLCALIADNPGRTRAQLSRLACRLLQWRKADGGLKEMSCRVAMLRMHREGLLQLPPPRNRKGGSTGRFTGACYKAANWIHVGQTQGRGKLDRDHKADLPTKSIWLYPLSKHFRRSLRST